jgi:hypothetical protein
MNERSLKIAKAEALYRDVNERIAETSKRFDSDEAEFMCECGDPGCAERLEAPLDEYERYAVVRKVDEAVARMVRLLDPRAA